MAYAELLMRKLDPPKEGDEESPVWSAAKVIFTQAERMAEIVRKIGKITRYETKSYVGRARILDLDRATGESDEASPQSGSGPRSSSPQIDVPSEKG
jgi:hypothetical protein